ncbi:hypothetical protein HDU67_008355 [Dinochytrium kinnereticum]|nr:hypothetical protein HDU67_008355 [Dinochytrium kinnereticum]
MADTTLSSHAWRLSRPSKSSPSILGKDLDSSSSCSSSSRCSTGASTDLEISLAQKPPPADVEKEVLEDDRRSILLNLISQLTKGKSRSSEESGEAMQKVYDQSKRRMDLHKVTLPTFVLEPRSMCERITDFMSHPNIVLKSSRKINPLDRFIDVVAFFLSGWHIRPKGVKKPFNPILGEFFRCTWSFPDTTRSIYICEQVSHHPPMSAYFYASPENDFYVTGDLRPKSKFLGNSAATFMQGSTRIRFSPPDDSDGEEYVITFPNMYARGLLFGTMYIELGDAGEVRCERSGLVCQLDFKTKGFFSGDYNSLAGKICKIGEGGGIVAKLSGKWSDTIFIERLDGSMAGKRTLFEVEKSDIQPKVVEDLKDQEEFESRSLQAKDIDTATFEKTLIEENQRQLIKKREAENVHWKPRFFIADGTNWRFDLKG